MATISIESIGTIVSGVSAIASGVVAVYSNGVKLLEIMKAAIVKVETVYSSLKATGADKKALVMAVLQAAASALKESWDSIKGYFSTLIDTVIDLYNTAKAVISGEDATETVAS